MPLRCELLENASPSDIIWQQTFATWNSLWSVRDIWRWKPFCQLSSATFYDVCSVFRWYLDSCDTNFVATRCMSSFYSKYVIGRHQSHHIHIDGCSDLELFCIDFLVYLECLNYSQHYVGVIPSLLQAYWSRKENVFQIKRAWTLFDNANLLTKTTTAKFARKFKRTHRCLLQLLYYQIRVRWAWIIIMCLLMLISLYRNM